ncbi:hypothetical protein, partial [Staphylococcus aureus]
MHAKKGLSTECKGCELEAVLRILSSTRDPAVAERPAVSFVYGGI